MLHQQKELPQQMATSIIVIKEFALAHEKRGWLSSNIYC
jgi:hypothetical protein